MEDIVKRAKEGDSKAFTALVYQISPKLYKVALKFLNNSDDIDDAIQETMYDAFKNLYQLKNPKKFESWITQILKNNCIKTLKNKNNNLLPLDENIVNNYPFQPEQEKIEGNITFQNIIKNFTEDEKLILDLKINHQYKYKEISEETNIPIKEIKKSFQKNKRKLKLKGLADKKHGKKQKN